MSAVPHSYACTNTSCPEQDKPKDALSPIVGDVICGACGSVCTDLGEVSES
jgi:hypothetical protein